MATRKTSGRVTPDLRTVLGDVTQLLRTELDLFGDSVLDDGSSPGVTETTVKPSSPVPQPEQSASLFAQGPTPPVSSEPWAAAASLDALNAQICECMKCPLGETRTKFVFGVGNPKASFMLVGEAPGADEDAQGEPFVGRAGQLLNKILEAIQFKRGDVYIANILKCRPPNNRKPMPEEVDRCLPYLRKQIQLIQPMVILCLGLTAAENLLGTKESLSKLRGRVLSFEGIPVMVTYHPAALLRNPNWKRPAWEDVQAIKKLHDERVQTRTP
jgi:uracil-DNA glycosylase